MSRKRSLGVIGLGHVGAHVAYTLAVQGIADELVLVDQNAQKLAGEVQDLRGRVFGTGTGLDTSRLLSALARQTGIDHKSITCYMLGEHGNEQFVPWSCVSFRGMPLDVWAETDERFRFDRASLGQTAWSR